jgi:SAM-dependent methyltransferase
MEDCEGNCKTASGEEAVRVPNRPFHWEDLTRPSFLRVLKKLDALVEREEISYLHPSKRWEYPWALERAGPLEGSRVLDLGCGASIFPIYLAGEGCRVTAVDVRVPPGLDRLHGVTVDYVEAYLGQLPFRESEFDHLFCISVIEHLPRGSVVTSFGEMRRVLRTGGRIFVTTDYYKDADAEIWYEGPDQRFRVDWNLFDRSRLNRLISDLTGLSLEGEIAFEVDWAEVSPRMRGFHGYPYTSIGFALVKE